MGELTVFELVQVCLAALGVGVLVHLAVVTAGDRYAVLVLPRAGGRPLRRRVRVFRPWFAPGAEVYHPELGRCEVARLDRTPDLGMPWVCVHPLDEEHAGWVPAAHWVPLAELGETPEEAERLDNLNDPGDPPVGGDPW